MDISKQVALVTGGSRGIGLAVATKLAAVGYDVAFCYRSASKEVVQRAVEKITAYGGQVFHRICDVSDMKAVKSFLEEAEAALGAVDVIVNSAGIIKDNPLVFMKPDEWHTVIDINLTGTFNVCRAAVFGFMKRKRGNIINISSVSGVYGNPTQVNYSASKAGLIGFSKALAKELGPYGVRVNVVAPGFIETDMTSSLKGDLMAKIINSIPLRRIGTAEEVADMVVFLAFSSAAYVTGQVFQVDGGIVL